MMTCFLFAFNCWRHLRLISYFYRSQAALFIKKKNFKDLQNTHTHTHRSSIGSILNKYLDINKQKSKPFAPHALCPAYIQIYKYKHIINRQHRQQYGHL